MRRALLPASSLALAAALLAFAAPAAAGSGPNGFDLAKTVVPAAEILAGGPARDAIHAVDEPEFAPAEAASAVGPRTPVVGVELAGKARGYPVHVLEFHQIVNDALAGTPIAVTYDPLTGTPRAFRRELDGRVLRFGVSGLVWNSGFLMFDRETGSLWSQFEGRALAGPLAGKRLGGVVVRQETMLDWLERAPESEFLERPERKRIDYRYSPYQNYWVQDEIPFAVAAQDRRYHAKEVVLGVVVKGKARAYLGSIATREGGRIEDTFEGARIRARYDTHTSLFRWEAEGGAEVTESYWFAWKAFHPDTTIWKGAPAAAPAE
jgi:hypothetical protein